jgi:hypothetical protein
MSVGSRRKTIIGGAFIPHTLEMRRSPAWRALPDTARRILDRLELEHMEHGGVENGRLICTYDQFAKAGIRRASLPLAIRQAVALGFLRITVLGGRAIADVRQPTRYRLTYPPGLRCLVAGSDQREEISPTNDWRLIKTDEAAAEALVQAATYRDRRTQPRRLKNKILDALSRPVPDAKTRPIKLQNRAR